MAELVGDAYVRIHADTTGMQRAIERDVERIADGNANSYLERFDRYVRDHSDAKLHSIYDSLARAIATGDWDRAFKQAGTAIDQFATDSRAHIISINDALERISGPGGGMEDFNSRLDELNRWAETQGLTRVIRDASGDIREATNETDDLRDSFYQASEGSDALRDSISNTRTDADRSTNAVSRLRRSLQGLGDDVDEDNNIFRRFSNQLGRTVVLLNRDTDIVGRMFGTGSRSELLNFFGRFIGFFASIPNIIGNAVAGASEGIADLVDQFQVLRGQGLSTSASLGSLGAVIGRMLIPGLIAVGASVAVLLTVLPAVILFLGHLIAAVVALASAILVGLVGAVTMLIGLIPALAAGIGFLIIGFTSLNDLTKKQKAALKPLTDAWKELKTTLSKQFFSIITENMDGLVQIIKNVLTPLLTNVSKVFSGLVKQFTDMFNSKQMKPFIDVLKTSIPKVLQSLGSAFVKFGAGLTAVFAALAPFAERLAKWIERAATKFVEWATSAQGQRDLHRWFEDLWSTARDLWSLLGKIGSVLGTVIKAATGVGTGTQGTGVSYLQSLADTLDRFDKWMNEDVSSDEMGGNRVTRIQQFFLDVQTTMSNLGTLLGNIGTALGKIDWEGAAKNIQTFLTTLSSVVEAVSNFIDTVNRIADWFQIDLPAALETADKSIEEFFGVDLAANNQEWGQNLYNALVQPWIDGWNALFGEGGWAVNLGDSLNTWWTEHDLVATSEEWNTNLYNALVKPWIDGWNALFGEGGWAVNLGNSLNTWWTEHNLVENAGEWGNNLYAALIQPWQDGWNALFGSGGFFPRMGEGIGTFFGITLPGFVNATANLFIGWYNSYVGPVFAWVVRAIATVIEWLGNLLIAVGNLPGMDWATDAGNRMLDAAGKARGLARDIENIPTRHDTNVNVNTATAATQIRAVQALLSGLRDKTVNVWVKYYELGGTQKTYGPQASAEGGMFYGPSVRLIGEAGPEAVVPLNRPLALVDPAVRWLSAIAQGKAGMATGSRVVFEAGSIVVNAATADPRLVAESVVDRIAARITV